MKNKITLLVIVAIFLIGVILYIAWSQFLSEPQSVPCTQEAKLCPDGSYVGRTGFKCEFSACPEENNELWKTTTNRGVTFQYPEALLTTYIHTEDWPPHIQILNDPFPCTEAGLETARAGKTEKRLVDGREYCRTSIVEGAAGSIYTQYAYAFPLNSIGSTQTNRKTVIFTFTTRATQCGNYGEAERKVCEEERQTFDIDGIVDRMARTLQFEKTTPQTVSSGVTGMVLLGPTCPVVQDPPNPECTDKPYATNLILTTTDQSHIIAKFSSGADGTFSLKIQPGEYAIHSDAAVNMLPYCSHDIFKVEANKFTNITVSCDTGIR